MTGYTTDAGRATAARWHAGLAIACALGGAAALAAFADAAVWAAVGLGAASAVGGLGALWRPAGERGRTALAVLWALASALAAAVGGGIDGPLAALALLPVPAAAVLGLGWEVGLALTLAVLASTAFGQACGLAPRRIGGGLGPTLALGALVGVAAASAAALRRQPARAEPVSTEPVRAVPVDTLADALAAQRAAEAARRDAEARADAADRAAEGRARFVANMSHELRTPLNAIIGFSDIMRARLFGPLSPKYGEYAQLIHESGGHLLDLINDVLDLSKIEAGRYELHREFLDAREPVAAALRILRVQADEAGVGLRGLLPGEPVEVDADRRAIKQIVLNLVSNALKFTPRGGSATVDLTVQGEALVLAVVDTGVGIAPADLERLGRPFEQVGDAAARAQGTGLGLSLVKALAQLHGGRMAIESRLGEGAAVTVTLPVLVAAAAAGEAGNAEGGSPLGGATLQERPMPQPQEGPSPAEQDSAEGARDRAPPAPESPPPGHLGGAGDPVEAKPSQEPGATG